MLPTAHERVKYVIDNLGVVGSYIKHATNNQINVTKPNSALLLLLPSNVTTQTYPMPG
jgi:hypothetical protein